MAKSEPTAEDVATWLFDELKRRREIYQEEAVDEIATKFGAQFTYDNEVGNPAIDKKVLVAFNKITRTEVVWERSNRLWRFREKGDEPSRMQP
jgi:hypothetical protein